MTHCSKAFVNLATLAAIICTIGAVKSCTIKTYDKTITLSSLADYNATIRSFSPGHLRFATGNVKFLLNSITKLQKDDLKRNDSDGIMVMSFAGQKIGTIEDGAFNGLDCLQELILVGNNVHSPSRNMFEGVPILKKLNLAGNLISTLHNGVFAGLSNLTCLNLTANRINSVYDLAFEGLKVLEWLDLSYNEIDHIPHGLFVDLKQLRRLHLQGNILTQVMAGHFAGPTRLDHLDLSMNDITSFAISFNSSFRTLRRLNLSGNALSRLNSSDLSIFLPYLTHVDVTGNDWICEDIRSLLRNLNATDAMVFLQQEGCFYEIYMQDARKKVLEQERFIQGRAEEVLGVFPVSHALVVALLVIFLATFLYLLTVTFLAWKDGTLFLRRTAQQADRVHLNT